ncbi:MAG: fumarylacetoacetate hydrolase family protein [Rhodospirillales bacterium]
MAADQATLEVIADKIFTAEKKGKLLAPISQSHPDLTPEECYAVQDLYVAKKLAGGDMLAGYKVGATGAASQQKFGVDEPVYGHMFQSGRVETGVTVPYGRWVHPIIECELGLRLGKDLKGPGVTLESALDAIDAVFGTFELIDSRTEGWQIGRSEMLCDNGVQAGFLAGAEAVPVRDIDPADITCVFRRNGEVIKEANTSMVAGNPVSSLVWLANKRGAAGVAIPAGSIILSGSLTGLTKIEKGDTFEAEFKGLETISITIN